MTDPQSAPYPHSLEAYTDFAKQQGLDFFSFHSPSDILAPHPDLFESELDSSLAAFDQVQLQLLTVDSNDAYSFLRSDTPTCGPPSTITVSSESAYDSRSSRSESFYNYPHSSYGSNYSFPLDLEMDFQRIRVDSVPDYAPVNPTQTNNNVLSATVDPTSFGSLPPTPPHSPHMPATHTKPFEARTSFSDYGAPTRVNNSSSSDYYSQLGYSASTLAQSTVSPTRLSPHVPIVASTPLASAPLARSDDDERNDQRKKYRCTVCPRSFARAYNLKTHMGTHDPNRVKPHVCPHHACERSFSRKHDLGRHLVSIHRDDSICSSHHSASTKKSIGVDKGPRGWCDSCGKGWVGRERDCGCHIK